MKTVDRPLPESDILFLVDTALPGRADREQAAALIRDDADFIDALLGDERVFDRLLNDDEALVHASPRLFFAVLLKRARRDLEASAYTVERRQHQRVVIFDSHQAGELLEQRPLRDYLAEMLASFTHVQSFTRRVRVRKGTWHRQRYAELDIDSLIRYCNTLPEEGRFQVYRRIADVCLFLAGVFPEYIESQSGPFIAARLQRTIEDYERQGASFYHLAANHRASRSAHLSGPLSTLADNFTLAEKPLTFISQRYLELRKGYLFGL